MHLLMEVADKQSTFPLYFVAVYAVGFMAALIIGSIAWSKAQERPTLGNKPSTDDNNNVATGNTEENSN
ncbi:MAG: hypothetical protein ACFBSE_10200 [Prochloraceae cyanobacterium]